MIYYADKKIGNSKSKCRYIYEVEKEPCHFERM